VGHSSAGTLAVELAMQISAGAIIVVDGDVPPAHGPASPVRPAFREFIQNLAHSDGRLPVWSRWFEDSAERKALVGLDQLAKDADAFAKFESELPRLTPDWFDDSIDLGHWQHIPAGYVQTSAIYQHAAVEAARREWPVVRLDGTHLHPTIRPDETARTLIEMAKRLAP
jgi:Alpha/beta hydrolase family